MATSCAREAGPDARRVALVVPPLATLLTVVVPVLVTDGWGSFLGFGLNVFRLPARQAAPMLLVVRGGHLLADPEGNQPCVCVEKGGIVGSCGPVTLRPPRAGGCRRR